MTQPPRRIHTHQIDTRACSIISTKFSQNWEMRDLTGRDFGIDKIVERFQDSYATSEIILLQIKGTETEIDINNPKFSLETKTLIYAEMFTVPFVLVFCDVLNPEKCYYLWLQEYIQVRLNYENPNWRKQQTNTVYFPPENILGTKRAEEHLAYISGFPKFKESWIKYFVSIDELNSIIPKTFCYDVIDKYYIDSLVKESLEKLELGTESMEGIPKRFIPDCYQETISLGKKILELGEKPNEKDFLRYVFNCQSIHTSISNIALAFDSSHRRLFYEIEGVADY